MADRWSVRADAANASCYAERVAAAYRRRFRTAALGHSVRRLDRARSQADAPTFDLFVAVSMILQDTHGVFSQSRHRHEKLVFRSSMEIPS